MAGEMNNYQYWGLVGTAVPRAAQPYMQAQSTIGSSMVSGYGSSAASYVQGDAAASAGIIQSAAYDMNAEQLEMQGQQEIINAKFSANARMDEFNQSASTNAAMMAAMGKSGENTTITDANYKAAQSDVADMKRAGLMGDISARSGAAAQRSAGVQAQISADTAYAQSRISGDSAVRQAQISANTAGKVGSWGVVSSISSSIGSGLMIYGAAPKVPVKA